MPIFEQPESMRENLLPGSLIHAGEQKMEEPRIRVFRYTQDSLEEREPATMQEALSFIREGAVTWINVDGLHDVEIFRAIQDHLQISPLVLEDILNTAQRPKYESRETYILLILKSIGYDQASSQLDIEQISFVFGKNYVLTFQERPGDFFESVRERIRSKKGRVRSRGTDYLAYALIDAIVDHYYKLPEFMGADMEAIEESVLSDASPKELEAIYNLKHQVVFLERAIWPLREMVNSMLQEESELVSETLTPFLRDLYDHVLHLIDAAQTLKDVLANLQELYMTTISNNTNSVMKVLAIIATIFIPLTFIAGVFGMNFEFMPELKLKGAYYVALGVMALIAALLTVYFKKKRWI